VARRAATSQDIVSRIERGQVDSLAVATLRRALAALDAELVLQVRWRGGELDRLLDEGHASLVGATVDLFGRVGWDVRLEVSFSGYRERGSIDLLAWHSTSQTLVVGEVKTEIASVEETLRTHDSKVRLGAQIALARFGWRTRIVTRLLILPETSTARRRIARHDAIFSRAYPVRGIELRTWLRKPDAMAGGLIFLSPTHGVRGIRRSPARKRIRRPSSSVNELRSRPVELTGVG
jgi:hypothetical protein